MIWTLQSLDDQILVHSLFKVKKSNLLDYPQSPREFDKEIYEESVVFVVVAKEIVEDFLEEPPEKVREVLKEFLDVFPFKLPDVLPHIITSTFKSSMEIVLFQWSQVFRHPDWRPYIDAWF